MRSFFFLFRRALTDLLWMIAVLFYGIYRELPSIIAKKFDRCHKASAD
jgi:hypothetical protein